MTYKDFVWDRIFLSSKCWKNYLKSCRQGSGHQEALRTSPDWLKEFRFDKNKTSGSAYEFLEHNWLIWAWDRIYYTQIETIIAKNCGVVVPRLTLTRPQLVRRLVCRQGAFVRSGKLRPCALASKDRDFRYVRAGIVFFATASSIIISMMRSIYDEVNTWLLRIDQTKPPTNFGAIRLENTISVLIPVRRRGRRQVRRAR